MGYTVIIEELVMNPTQDPYLTILASSIIFLWGVRVTLAVFLYNPIAMPRILTPEFIDQLRGLDLFKEEFLAGLWPGRLNPLTPTLIDRLRWEFAIGDQVLYDTGIHTIFSYNCPSVEDLIQELTLIAPILPY